MRYRPLGATGLVVSEIGFGAWGIGGTANGAVAYGPTNDQESRRALRRAFDLGVTFFDTADLYGDGHSERLIGQALGAVRSEVVIATKVGMRRSPGEPTLSPTSIRRALEASLERLGTTYVDLYQLHSPTLETLSRDGPILETLEALRREGKVRALGISVRSPDDGLVAVETLGFRAVQVNFSLADQRALRNGLLARSAERNAGLIVRTPLCFGFLAGQSDPEATFAATDHRSRWSREQIRRWAGARQLFARALAAGPAGTAAQGALRFCLSYGAVSTAIPGMLTTAHVEENVAASGLGPFSAADLRALEEIGGAHEFFLERRAS